MKLVPLSRKIQRRAHTLVALAETDEGIAIRSFQLTAEGKRDLLAVATAVAEQTEAFLVYVFDREPDLNEIGRRVERGVEATGPDRANSIVAMSGCICLIEPEEAQ